MKFSTRGRYALRVMLDLAEHIDTGYTPMKTVAERQGLSLKYLEQILPILSKNELIRGIRGKVGGYQLAKPAEQITVGEILRLTEGDLAPIACLECGKDGCERRDSCRTLPMWRELHRVVTQYLEGVTLADLLKNGADTVSAELCLSDDACL